MLLTLLPTFPVHAASPAPASPAAQLGPGCEVLSAAPASDGFGSFGRIIEPRIWETGYRITPSARVWSWHGTGWAALGAWLEAGVAVTTPPGDPLVVGPYLDTDYGVMNWTLTICAINPPSPTPTPANTISVNITDSQATPMDALATNADGWPMLRPGTEDVANPISVSATFVDRGWHEALTISLGSALNRVRFVMLGYSIQAPSNNTQAFTFSCSSTRTETAADNSLALTYHSERCPTGAAANGWYLDSDMENLGAANQLGCASKCPEVSNNGDALAWCAKSY